MILSLKFAQFTFIGVIHAFLTLFSFSCYLVYAQQISVHAIVLLNCEDNVHAIKLPKKQRLTNLFLLVHKTTKLSLLRFYLNLNLELEKT